MKCNEYSAIPLKVVGRRNANAFLTRCLFAILCYETIRSDDFYHLVHQSSYFFLGCHMTSPHFLRLDLLPPRLLVSSVACLLLDSLLDYPVGRLTTFC